MKDNFEKIDVSISAIRGFNDLILAAFLQGEDMRQSASGIFYLLNSQVEILEAANGENRKEIKDLEKREQELRDNVIRNSNVNKINNLESGAESALNYSAASEAIPGADYYRENQLLIARLHDAGKTIEEIGVLTGLGRDRVRIFIEAMPDYVFEEVRTQADPRELRSAFIAERIRDGYNSSEIANALNLKKITVEKVINRLLNAGGGNAEKLRRAGNE